MKKKGEYMRLPGRGLMRGGLAMFVRTRCSLWLGEDHLLSLHSTGYNEEYKRFYFHDIQAIVTTLTNRRRYQSMVLLAALLMTALLYTLWPPPSGSPFVYAYSIALGLFLLLLLVTWLRGPTCACYLRTAVSEEKLYSLGLARTAARAIAILKPHIEAAQGRLEQEYVSASLEETGGAPQSAATRPKGAQESANQYGGNLHAVLFILLLAGGLFESADFFYNHEAIALAETIVYAAAGIVSIAALVRLYAGNIRKGLAITWAALGYLCVSYIIGCALVVYISITHLGEIKSDWEMLRKISSLSPLDSPLLTAVSVFLIATPIVIGMFGMLSIRGMRNDNTSLRHLRAAVGKDVA